MNKKKVLTSKQLTITSSKDFNELNEKLRTGLNNLLLIDDVNDQMKSRLETGDIEKLDLYKISGKYFLNQ